MTNKQLAWFGFLLLAVTWPVVENYFRQNNWRARFKRNVQYMPDREKMIAQEFNVQENANAGN